MVAFENQGPGVYHHGDAWRFLLISRLGFLIIRATLFWVYVRAPVFWDNLGF